MTAPFLFLLAAVVCFAVALLLALGVFHGPQDAWALGGLLALALSLLPGGKWPARAA